MSVGPLHVRALGHFAVAADPQFVTPLKFSTRKVAALLLYLALARQQSASREQLATLLWSEGDDRQARHNLRQALVYLRRDLGAADIVEADADIVRLRPGSVTVDALELERLAPSSNLDDLAHAAALFQGEMMAGFKLDSAPFEEWLESERRRIATIGTGALERHAAAADAAGRSNDALSAAERLLALDPLREDWQRLVLAMLARHRGRGEALARAKAFAELIQRELGAEPEEETQRLVGEIRLGADGTAAAALQASEPLPPPAASTPRAAPAVPAPVAAPADRGNDLRRPEPNPRTKSPPTWPARWRTAAALLAMAAVLSGPSLWLAMQPTAAPALAVALATPADTQAVAPKTATAADWTPPSRDGTPARGASKGIIPIAVLPFVSGDGSQAADALGETISDDVTTILSTAQPLRVISRQTARAYKGQTVEARSVGTALGVAYLLEGSVSTSGGRVRVNVGLVDTQSGMRVWSRRIERETEQSDAITDEIVNSICHQLVIEFSRLEVLRSSNAPQVHEHIARGRAKMFDAGLGGVETLHEAERHFEAALALEPDNIQALVGLGGYHANMGLQLRAVNAKEHQAKAEANLQRARQLGAKGASLYSYLGLLHVSRREINEAKIAFEQSIAVNPSHAPGYAHLGRVLVRLGEAERGLEHTLYAIRLSPRDPHLPYWQAMAGAAEVELGRIDSAVQRLERAHASNRTVPRTLMGLIAAHALHGDITKARSYLAELRQITSEQSIDILLRDFKGQAAGKNLARGFRMALGTTEPR